MNSIYLSKDENGNKVVAAAGDWYIAVYTTKPETILVKLVNPRTEH